MSSLTDMYELNLWLKQQVSLFRRHHFSISMSAQSREAMKFWEERTNHGQYLLVMWQYGIKCSLADKCRLIFVFHIPSPLLSQLSNDVFTKVYDCGKSATRVLPGVSVQSVHHFKLPKELLDSKPNAKKTGLADPRNLKMNQLLIAEWPCVLHYVTCGLEWFKDK